jgi:hypothetical protein
VNSEVYDDKVEFPNHLRDHMRASLNQVKNVPKDSKGYKRNVELQGQKTITYTQLRRIKNFFDNYKGKQTDPAFILNGGILIKNWVNNELRRMSQGIHQSKKTKMDTGMQNQFIQNHKKDGIDVRPSKEHVRTVDRYNTQVTEQLKRINELIFKI